MPEPTRAATGSTAVPSWTLEGEDVVIDSAWLRMTSNTYALPDGRTLRDYFVLHEVDGVTVLALTPEHRVLVVRQYRPPLGKDTVDLPAGRVDDSDPSLLAAAERELREETGYVAAEWEYLGAVHPAPERSAKRNHLFLATQLTRNHEQSLDEFEEIRYEEVEFTALMRMIEDGDMTCGTCVSGVLRAARRIEAGRTR